MAKQQLPGNLHQKFQFALLGAFRDFSSLEQMVRFQMNEDLSAIVGSGTSTEVVFNLITWADANNRVDELISAARKTNPGNQALIDFENHYFRYKVEDNNKSGSDVYSDKKKIEIIDPLYPEKMCFGVDRKKQRNEFLDALYNAKLKRSDKNLLSWYGRPGIGKSSLVRLLMFECKERQVPYILIDFGSPDFLGNFIVEPIIIVEQIVSELSKYTSQNIMKIENAISEYKQLTRSQEVTLYVNERPEWLLDKIKHLLVLISGGITSDGGYPIVFFFDGCDNIIGSLQIWIEEIIMRPLLDTEQGFFVVVSRQKLRWGEAKNYKLPRNDDLENELSFFDKDAVCEQLSEQLGLSGSQQYIANQICSKVFSITCGHPYATWEVVQKLASWVDFSIQPPSIGDQFTLAISQKEPELYEQLFSSIILNYALKGVSDEEQKILEACSLIRKFDARILQKVVRESSLNGQFTKNEPFTKEDYKFFSGQIAHFISTGLLLKKEAGGCSMDRYLRRILGKHLQIKAKELYIAINQSALDFYEKALSSEFYPNHPKFIIEELYYSLVLLPYLGHWKVNIVDRFIDRLDQLQKYGSKVEDADISLSELEDLLIMDEDLQMLLSINNQYNFKFTDLIDIISNKRHLLFN